MSSAPPLIDASHAAFLEAGVSMSVGACGPDRHPVLVRGSGCRVDPGRRRVTVFVSRLQAQPVLDCIRANGMLAVVFSQPSTHRTVQLKGRDACIADLAQGDLERIDCYRRDFAIDLEPLGFNRPQVEALLGFAPDDLVAIVFTPSEAYVQTPGPQAGARLGAAA